MGRPTKITEKKLNEIEKLASEGLSLRSIEAFADITDGLLRKYWSKGEKQKGIGLKVFHRIKKGRAKIERECLTNIRNRVQRWTASARLLEALHIWDKRDEDEDKDRQIIIKWDE